MADTFVSTIILEILAGLILAGIAGGISSMIIIYKCVHKQAQDMKLMKKATAFVLRRQVNETKTLHPENKDEIEDLEKTYKEFIDSE